MNSLTPVQGRDFSLRGTRMMRRVERMPKPVIAMVNGFALGGGWSWRCAAICASPRIRRRSVTGNQSRPDPGFGGTQRLSAPSRPRGNARAVPRLARPIDALARLQLGIVNRVVPAAELEAETMKLAEQLANAAPLACAA
jgi:enoyl-CoA hydratase